MKKQVLQLLIKKTFLLLSFFLLFVSLASNAQTTGTVFRDYSGDGTRQTTTATVVEPLVEGVIVNAYNSSDVLIASYKSGSNGAYSIPTTGSAYNGTPGSNTGFVAGSTAIRLEFVIPETGTLDPSVDYTSHNGVTNGTSVRFITSGTANNNYAINSPEDYVFNTSSASNTLYFAVQALGNSTASTGTSSGNIALYKQAYTANGTMPTFATADKLATMGQIGSVYGVAYSRQANKIFVGSFLKRHAGLGPANGSFNNAPGAIYIVDPTKNSTNGAASYFTSLDALGYATHNSTGAPAYGNNSSYTITTNGLSGDQEEQTINYSTNGLGVIGTNTQRGLPNDFTTASNDPAAFGQVFKVGLGDVDISDDGKYLFVTNLYDRKIYVLELNSITNPTSASVVKSYSLPNPPLRSLSGVLNADKTYVSSQDNTDFYTGDRGLQRPFGLKYYRGKLYVAGTTTGEGPKGASIRDDNEGNPEYTDLWAYTWELDVQNGFNTTPILQFPLNFDRDLNIDNVNETWGVWSQTLQAATNPDYNLVANQQPIFSDIEFDEGGTMILAFRDRNGDQMANANGMLSGTNTGDDLRSSWTYGDVYRAYYNKNNNTYEFEYNGKEGKSSPKLPTLGAFNNQGNGGGEFYYQDGLEIPNGGTPTPAGQTYHQNCGMGSMALLPGKQEILTTQMDPMQVWSGGISTFNNVNGSNSRDLELYSGNTTGQIAKANGLGDLELFGQPAPIEIGNRVWSDTDADGIQDAGEAGISGVTVQLYTNGADGIAGNADDVLVATATTSTNGNYYFTTATGTNTASVIYGLSISSLTSYNLRIGSGDWSSANAGGIGDLANKYLTRSNIQGNGAEDISDNDATINSSGYPMISFTTGTSGQNNHDLDFGFSAAYATLGNRVWFDENNNGDFDEAASNGLNGVTVNLYKESSPGSGVYNLFKTEVTADDQSGNPGFYEFVVLDAANYKVQFVTAASELSIYNPAAGVDNNSDANPANGFTEAFALNPAGTGLQKVNYTLDAGIKVVKIGDYVWMDANGDGLQDAAETGIAGVELQLFDNAGNAVYVCKSENEATNFSSTSNNTGSYGFGSSWTLSGTNTAISGGELAVSGATGDAQRLVVKPTLFTVDTVKVSFDLKTTDLTSGETFLAQYYNGTAWVTLGTYTSADLSSSYTTFSYSSKTIPGLLNIQSIRFKEGVYADAKLVYVDNLNIEFKQTCKLAKVTTDASGEYSFNNLEHDLQANTQYEIRIAKTQTGLTDNTITVTTSGNTATDNNGTSQSTYYTSGLITSPAVGSDLSIDFGFIGYTVGNTVWWDANNNGTKDAGEAGIGGVNMALLNSDGSLRATTTTDANGKYYFSGLPAGNYQVAITSSLTSGVLKGGSIPTTTTTADVDNNNNGSATNPNSGNPAAVTFASISEVFTLGGKSEPTNESDEDPNTNQPDNQSNLTIDFGVYRFAIGDYVWLDADFDGIQDSDETGIAGIEVELYNASGNLVYTSCSADSNATNFNSTSDNTGGNRNFATSWSLSGTNTAVTGGQLRVYGATGVATRTVNKPTAYTINQAILTFDAYGTNVSLTESMLVEYYNGTSWITLTALYGQTESMGNLLEGSGNARRFSFTSNEYVGLQNIQQIRFRENPSAGYADADYVTIDNLKIVYSQTCEPARVTTDAFGNYNFNSGDHNITASTTYSVRIYKEQTELADYKITAAAVGGNTAIDNNGTLSGNYFTTGNFTSPASGQNLTLDFGFYPVKIGDYVWLDANADGIQDSNEEGIEGVTLQLYQTNGNPATYACASDSIATNMGYSGDNQGNISFGGKWVSTTSAATLFANGELNFLAGYDVSRMYTLPSNYTPTSVTVSLKVRKNSAVGTSDNMTVQYYTGSSWITLGNLNGSNVTSTSSYNTVTFSSSSVGGLLTSKGIRFVNGSGIDAGDYFYISELKINAVGTCEIFATTDASGYYEFNPSNGLAPNTQYEIRIAESQSSVNGLAVTSTGQGTTSTDNNGTDGGAYTTSGTITSPTSGQNLDYDFGFKGYSIGNLVWWDLDNNGTKGGSEAGVPGVSVILINAQGEKVQETTTDANGKYYFHGLLPGNYQVAVTSTTSSGVLSGSMVSAVTTTTADTDNNNNGSATDPAALTLESFTAISDVIVLGGQAEPTNETDEDPFTNQADNMSNLAVDFGFYKLRIGDRVWMDANANGIQDDGEVGIAGVEVLLYDNAGNPATNGSGAATCESAATDFSSTTDNDGTVLLDAGGWVFSSSGTPSTYLSITGNELNIRGTGGPDGDIFATRAMTPPTSFTISDVEVCFDARQSGFGTGDALQILYDDGTGYQVLDDLTNADLSGTATTHCYTSTSVSGLTNIEGIRFRRINYGFSTTAFISNLSIEFCSSGGTITCASENVSTDFSSNSASDNDGTINFNGSWALSPVTGSTAQSGDTKIVNNELSISGLSGVATRNITQPTSLASIDTVIVSFSLKQIGFGGGFSPDNGIAEYWNGSGWVNLGTYSISQLPVSGTYYNFSYSSTSISGLFNIGGIRFREGEWASTSMNFIADNVKVEFKEACTISSGGTGEQITAITDSDGYYSFDAADGLEPSTTYKIRINEAQAPLTGLAITSTGAGTTATDNNASDSGTYVITQAITSPASGDDLSFDFGFTGYSIGNQVWWDNNNDGIKDATEIGIAGISLSLLAAAGEVVATTTTSSDGKYIFSGLLAGNYQVAVTNSLGSGLLENATISSSTTTTEDLDNRNDGSATNPQGPAATSIFFSSISPVVTLGGQAEPTTETDEDPNVNQPDNQSNLTVDFGFVPTTTALGNFVFWDKGNDGAFDAGTDEPLADIKIYLYKDSNGDGTPDAKADSVLTDANGLYAFEVLGAGTFQLVIAPENFLSGGKLATGTATTNANSQDALTDYNSEGTQSSIITLAPNSQPVNDDGDDSSTLYGDNDANFTFDFGFYGNGGGPVPVELISFEAEKSGAASLLTWETATELNNDRFEVERKGENGTWAKIGEVKGAGNSNEILKYAWLDESPLLGMNYYRLRQVDFDGQFTYTEERTVMFGEGLGVLVYPNPARGEVYVSVTGARTDNLDVAITDVFGKEVQNVATVKESGAYERLKLDMSGLRSGYYFIRITNGSQTNVVKLLIAN